MPQPRPLRAAPHSGAAATPAAASAGNAGPTGAAGASFAGNARDGVWDAPARDSSGRDATPREATPRDAGRQLLFLREAELRLAQDLLYFGYRDFTAGADGVLETLGMGRAHHRVLHFVGRRPGITVGELLGILGITKQSLGRVLTPLVDDEYVLQVQGRTDRRQRLLTLGPKGAALERQLFECQRETVMRAYREAGPVAVEGFRQVMRGLMGPEARQQLARLEQPAAGDSTAAPQALSGRAPVAGLQRGGR